MLRLVNSNINNNNNNNNNKNIDNNNISNNNKIDNNNNNNNNNNNVIYYIPSLEWEDANCQHKPKIYSEKSRKSKNCHKIRKFVSLSLKIPFIQIEIFYQKVAELLHILIKPFMGSYFIF